MGNITVQKNPGTALATNRVWDPLRRMRDLLSWDPFQELMELPREVEMVANFTPAFEIKETADGFVFKADVPGMKEQDLDIAITGNRLTVSGKREAEKENKGDTFYTYERSYGSFSRSFTLPLDVNGDQARAELKDGVLLLNLPKLPEAQAKKISVKQADKAKA